MKNFTPLPVGQGTVLPDKQDVTASTATIG